MMSNTRLPSSIFFSLALLGAVQYFYYAPRLPEIVASHFGRAGSANGWQVKTVFFSMEVGVIVLATVISFGVPRIIEALPVSMINLPHKEFWLSPERRDETLSYLRVWTLWFGCALLAFLLFVMELVFRANFQTPPQLNMMAFMPVLFGFVAFDTIAIIRLVLHFSRIQVGMNQSGREPKDG
jgi:uncharacterized membrane protein